ncbi:hypothetical protein J2O02_18320 (plasmid) [Elizabethkingia anophelis]|uniref:hypothetical protein n=1 Tax=Elizabethkingia anophelis TaxID=1117645 RepID=UPI0020B8262E|nr:hypothetical protein [Elizabethkingia anophelis]UTG66822.1 hypothetical protein J2O02_18320 [Elizabethkingia anophelis]
MKSNLGENLYTALKKNNSTTKIVTICSSLVTIAALAFSFMVYKESSSNIFGVTNKGDLIPLSKIEGKEAEIIQAKANISYFVENYYSLNAYNMKTKREKVYWLVGKQPTEIIKDRATKGYFDNFLTVQGLQQNARILEQTLNVSSTYPYHASFVVRIERTNSGVTEYYNNTVNMVMEKVNRNYPYNPFGFLITQFSESLERITDPNTDAEKAIIKQSDEEINQNPKEKSSEIKN